MKNVYTSAPEYSHKPLTVHERKAAYEQFLDIADIDMTCSRNPNGFHIGKRTRILGSVASREALSQLKLLNIVEFSNVHNAIVNPAALLFTDAYIEEHAREAFRFSQSNEVQYYWEGSMSALQEVRDRERTYRLLKEEGALRPVPTIPRASGQFTSGF